MLITSRSRLTGLAAGEGAHLLPLGVLTDSESRDLLTTSLGAGRVMAEPAAVSELIGLCARLPLALRDVAARVAARPGLPLTWLAAEMRDARAAAGEEPELQLDGADQNGLDAFPVEK